MIGQDSRGNWVVRDQNGLRGGLFVGRAGALRYVRDEAGNHPRAIVMVNGAFELDTSGTRRPSARPPGRVTATSRVAVSIGHKPLGAWRRAS